MPEHQNHRSSANGRVARHIPGEMDALLSPPLDPALRSLRAGHNGRMVAYVEGYHMIKQANRIFGYGQWGSEIVGSISYEDVRGSDPSGAASTVRLYSARVRVRVRGCEARSDVGCAVV